MAFVPKLLSSHQSEVCSSVFVPLLRAEEDITSVMANCARPSVTAARNRTETVLNICQLNAGIASPSVWPKNASVLCQKDDPLVTIPKRFSRQSRKVPGD